MATGRVRGTALAPVLFLLALAACDRPPEPDSALTATSMDADPADAATHQGFQYGRVTTNGGTVYEGRFRWGGDEEALWGDYFNGYKDQNPWSRYAPTERRSIGAFGIEIAAWESDMDPGRPFMARFGDIERIELSGRDINVTLKSGTRFELDLFSSDDLGDDLRVWDESGAVVDLDERAIRSIEFLPAPAIGDAAEPVHGTVRTTAGDFTGLIMWNRTAGVGSDELEGFMGDSLLSLRFDTIRSIAPRATGGSLVTLLDGPEVVLTGTREVGRDNRGMYVDDPRYGRVLVSWDVVERVDFSPGGTGPGYDDFPAGHPLTGTVMTRSGRTLTGRLVYDLDESETTETLDAPAEGIDYTIFFGLVASIVPAGPAGGAADRALVTLHDGGELLLEPAGDLGQDNAGMLIFPDGDRSAEYVPWMDVERIDFDRPPTMYPPGEQRPESAQARGSAGSSPRSTPRTF